MTKLLRGIPESRGGYRYAEGKWSIKDLVQHLSDAERVFAYRTLRFARNDPTELPGWDENVFAKNVSTESRSVADVADEFDSIRRSTLTLLRPLDDDAMSRSGIANGKRVTARAIAWIIAGHAEHHVKVLRDRYL